MKKASAIILFFIFISTVAFAKRTEKFYPYLKIDGLQFLSVKRSILKTFGKPEKEFRPKYECGFLSEDEQQKPFFSLKYKQQTWTGNEKDGYILEQFSFTPEFKNRITYQGKVISGQTTQAEFAKLSGGKSDKTNVIRIAYLKSDDQYIFHFKNGKLWEIKYWSPC